MQTEEKPIKVYVDVMASFNAEGAMMPQQLTWEDGTQYS